MALSSKYLLNAVEALFSDTCYVGLGSDVSGTEITSASYARISGSAFDWDYTSTTSPNTATVTNQNSVYFGELGSGESYSAVSMLVFNTMGGSTVKSYVGAFVGGGVSVTTEQMVKIGAYATYGGNQTRGVKVILSEVT